MKPTHREFRETSLFDEDNEHARAESALAEIRAHPLRALPLQQLSDSERNDLVRADFWARQACAKSNARPIEARWDLTSKTRHEAR
ncbi:MAG TPA: hypothetical protein VGM74_15285 [Burkholderiaceae bacterium]|jgi:hypothetical protein